MRIALVTVCKCELGRMPIGLLCLHAWLRKHAPQHEVKIVDSGWCDPLDVLVKEHWDLIGISSMTPEYESATQLAGQIRKVKPDACVIVGGAHISKLPSSLRTQFVAGVVGEGEATLLDIVKTLESGSRDLRTISGLVLHTTNGPVETGARNPISLEDFPALDYSAVDPRYFQKHPIPIFARFGIEGIIMSSRGCPYKCVFCASGNFYRAVRYFSPEWVLNEIHSLIKMGATCISFFDDVFAFHKPRLRAIAAGVIERCWHENVEFYANAKADVLDDEICDILKSFNMRSIFFGFESGSPSVLKYLKRGRVTVEDNKNAVWLGLKHGFRVTGNVIIGSPPETLNDIEQTIQFINWAWKQGVARITASILTPYPGTPLWDEAKAMGRVSDTMNFDSLTVNVENEGLGGFVSTIPRDEFIKAAKKTLKAIHKFKWRKFKEFLIKDSLGTLTFIINAPWPLIRRMFVRTSV